MGAESFTVLAILEARDRASEIFARVDESLDKFSETAKTAADSARSAGAAIDESLTQTASGASALDVADARVAASQERAARAAQAQADAERELLDAQKAAAAAADGDTAAQDRLLAASDRLTAAQRESAVSAKALSDAQKAQAGAAAAAAAENDAAAAGQAAVRDTSEASALSLGKMGRVAGIAALGLGIAGALMVKAAGNFQDSTTHLVTDAGESAKNLSMVQAGILQVSTATGQSASDITNAMYHIESGGMHGASGLSVLKVAAEGARVGGADLDTVSKTLVGTLNAYGMTSKNAAVQTQMATSMMSQLVATVGAGDMRMQDLASSLSSVAPLAAAVHIKFAQVGGAIATMTAQGMSAQQATQDLANTIRSLSNPNSVAIAEMNQLGINAQDVSQHLGQRGLTGTIGMLTQAITSHMGKSGQVIMSAFTQSTTAGQDLQIMLKSMPPQFQALAQGFMAGSISAKQWKADLQAQTPVNQKLMTQFATLYEKSHSFNSLLASGGPAAQTYTAALAKMMGGATGLNTALMLTGKNQAVFAANVRTVGAAASSASGFTEDWAAIQGTFNFKMAQAKTAVENTGIAIGTAILPAVTSLLQAVTRILVPIAEWTSSHKTLTGILFAGVTAIAATVAVLAAARKAFTVLGNAVDTAKAAFNGAKTAVTALRDSQVLAAAASRLMAAGQAILNAVMDANPIMLVVIALAALAAGIAYAWTHFATFRKIAEDVFGWLRTAVTAVISFVKSHWALLAGIFGGPLALVVAQVVRHWNDIKKWFTDGVHSVESILRWFTSLPGKFASWIGGAADSVAREGSRVLGWFRSLPGRIMSLIASIPGQLFGSGLHIVESLANGIISGAGSALSGAMSSVADTIKSFLPFSPARRGPLSGAGDPGNSGLSIARMVAGGIRSGTPQVAGAAGRMAASILSATSGLSAGAPGTGTVPAAGALSAVPGGGAAGGGQVIQLNVTGNTVMNTKDIDVLTEKIGRRLSTVLLPSAGRKGTFS